MKFRRNEGVRYGLSLARLSRQRAGSFGDPWLKADGLTRAHSAIPARARPGWALALLLTRERRPESNRGSLPESRAPQAVQGCRTATLQIRAARHARASGAIRPPAARASEAGGGGTRCRQ